MSSLGRWWVPPRPPAETAVARGGLLLPLLRDPQCAAPAILAMAQRGSPQRDHPGRTRLRTFAHRQFRLPQIRMAAAQDDRVNAALARLGAVLRGACASDTSRTRFP
jgi:hypothetical protein